MASGSNEWFFECGDEDFVDECSSDVQIDSTWTDDFEMKPCWSELQQDEFFFEDIAHEEWADTANPDVDDKNVLDVLEATDAISSFLISKVQSGERYTAKDACILCFWIVAP